MEQYQPISLSGVMAKTISKVLTNRLQRVLPDVISPSQSAFIKDRSISDNFLIAHETSHYIQNQTGSKGVYGSLKLDMSKAFDRLEWKYLKLILLQLGFHIDWVSKVMSYVTTVNYRLRINDDSILYFKAEESTPTVLKKVLSDYETISGQQINFQKSEVVLSSNASAAIVDRFDCVLHVRKVPFHEKYLGLPLLLKRSRCVNFTCILDLFAKKTLSWQSSHLSSGGKEVLLKSVLQALPQYWMHCFLEQFGIY
ncbi:hypothetical protein QQ045_009339 [Rhodiola kirilowii]